MSRASSHSTSRGTLLLVSPGFHGYGSSIADAFTQLGWRVHTHTYDAFTGGGRARHKVLHELPELVGVDRTSAMAENPTRSAVECVTDLRPDAVVTVKGDLLGEDYWDAVERVAPRHLLWLYDEVRRTRHTPLTLARPQAIASYSRADVADLAATGVRAAHVPLAFDHTTPRGRIPSDDIVFVGARYANREALLLTLHTAGYPVRAYGRDWSRHPFDRARTWRLRRPPMPSGRDLARPQAYAVMAGAVACLNVHGDQDGFTMRTFEACGVGAVQLIDRPDVAEFYAPGLEVAVYTTPDELLDLAARATADVRWATSLRTAGQARTLAEHTFVHRARALESLWD